MRKLLAFALAIALASVTLTAVATTAKSYKDTSTMITLGVDPYHFSGGSLSFGGDLFDDASQSWIGGGLDIINQPGPGYYLGCAWADGEGGRGNGRGNVTSWNDNLIDTVTVRWSDDKASCVTLDERDMSPMPGTEFDTTISGVATFTYDARAVKTTTYEYGQKRQFRGVVDEAADVALRIKVVGGPDTVLNVANIANYQSGTTVAKGKD